MARRPATTCPLLTAVTADWLWLYPTVAYCRPESGRLRVPSAGTVARVCTTRRHTACPAYRRWRAATGTGAAPA